MASPVQTPPPAWQQQQQPQRRRRSIAGPVVLILLGVVLLLTTMHVLHPEPLLRWFGTYWPAFIILWGVIKLVEYQQAQKEGVRPSGIGAGGVLLLVFLIVFGMSATQASRLNWDAIREHINWAMNDFQLFGHTYDYDDQSAAGLPGGRQPTYRKRPRCREPYRLRNQSDQGHCAQAN